MVKTNKETMELPLLITKAQTAPLMGLDWMQRLKINFKQRRNPNPQHKVGQHRKKNHKTPERLQRFVLQQQRDKESLSEKVFENWSSDNTTKRTTNPTTFTIPSGTGAETPIITWLCRKGTRNY